MTLHQVFKNNTLIADNVNLTEAQKHIPAGSTLVSGNQTKTINKPEGGIENVTEIKAVFKIPGNGGTITIIQKP